MSTRSEQDPDDTCNSKFPDKRQSIEIPVPWSAKVIKIRNYDVCFIILAIGFTAAGYFMQGMYDKQNSIVTSQTEILKSLNEMTYVLSIRPEDRDKLNLQMPDSLRQKTSKQ